MVFFLFNSINTRWILCSVRRLGAVHYNNRTRIITNVKNFVFHAFRDKIDIHLFLLTLQRTYPVYAVGDYAGGQQYYATTASNFTTSSSSSNGNANSNSYIVPVDDAILGVSQSRGSPQTISTVSALFFSLKQFNEAGKLCGAFSLNVNLY